MSSTILDSNEEKGTKRPEEIMVSAEWSEFLQRIPGWERLSSVQRGEMRKAFYAGFGQCLVLMRDRVTEYSEEAGAEILQGLLEEIGLFWIEAEKEWKSRTAGREKGLN